MIRRDPRLPAQDASALHGVSAPAPKPQSDVAEIFPEVAAAAEVDAKADEQPSRAGRRIGLVMAGLVMIGLVVVVVFGFLKFLNGPVEADAKSAGATPAPSGAPKPTTNQLAGIYFDMIYPGIFDQVGTIKNDNQSLERYTISSKKDYRRVIAVSVYPLEAGLLENNSSYKFRHINPKDYKESAVKLHGETGVLMSKSDNVETTLFWAHKDKVLIVAITSNNPEDVVADFMTAIEPTVRWRE
jgi:hypothetical protein